MHQSIATIDSPEFINLQPLDINPLMSSCEIKVLYLGENRNHSFISKEVATDMAKSLRGAPIVGYYRTDTEDFGDHGERVIFENGDIKFECMTVPYGFVSPDAQVWFQKFDDTDDFGNIVTREYLMTTGFLWTGQFEEAKLAVDGDGRPHSMELDEETLDGKWSQNIKTGMDFFIINDAIFSKLCILGEDVEPCFEGSSITAPKVSTSFTKLDDNFKQTLYTMMQELRFALEKGGQENMDGIVVENTSVVEENSENVQGNVEQVNTEEIEVTTEDTTFTAIEDAQTPVEEEASTENVEAETEFVQKKDEEEEDSKEDSSKDEEEKDSEDSKEDEKSDEEDEDEKKKYALLEQKYNELETQFTQMKEEYQALVEFKAQIEDAKKDDLIKSFYMLDDADKKDIIENKSKYSLEDIEAKLSIIYTRKRMSFELEQQQKNEEENTSAEVVTTFNLADDVCGLPDWIKEVRKTEERMNF